MASLPHNIEKAAFPTSRKKYVGYGRGIVWRIYRESDHWAAVAQDHGPYYETALTLAALSVKIS